MKDGFALLRRVVFEVVEFFHAFAVALEGLGAGEKAKVFGIGTELVLEGVTHADIKSMPIKLS